MTKKASSMLKSKTIIVDGNHLAHRAKYSFNLSNKGTDTSVTYGFIRTLWSYIRRFHPESVVVCWDGGVPEHRRKALPEYKANRHKDDDPLEYENFQRQMRELRLFALPLMGIISVHKPSMEADDLVYHASRILDGNKIVISGDHDLLQCISDDVMVYHPGKDILFDSGKLEEVFGISLKQFVDWKALQGDSSDNIPGVPGIGEKTATKLFHEYDTLTGITNAAAGINPKGKIVGKIGENICTFGLDRIAKNVYVMALYADRVGARKAIIDAINSYKPTNKSLLKRYYISNGFISLHDGELYNTLGKLRKPDLELNGYRVPIVLNGRRQPVDD